MIQVFSRPMSYGQYLKSLLPSVLTMIFLSFYTTIDGFFVSRYAGSDALAGITGRYAVLAADTGFACAFALSSGVFSPLAPDAPVDVSIVGGEADLLAVFRHELAPLKALLGGKVRVRGDRAALLRFAPFL